MFTQSVRPINKTKSKTKSKQKEGKGPYKKIDFRDTSDKFKRGIFRQV